MLTLEFSEDYPNKAPVVKFRTRMFHPNSAWRAWPERLRVRVVRVCVEGGKRSTAACAREGVRWSWVAQRRTRANAPLPPLTPPTACPARLPAPPAVGEQSTLMGGSAWISCRTSGAQSTTSQPSSHPSRQAFRARVFAWLCAARARLLAVGGGRVVGGGLVCGVLVAPPSVCCTPRSTPPPTPPTPACTVSAVRPQPQLPSQQRGSAAVHRGSARVQPTGGRGWACACGGGCVSVCVCVCVPCPPLVHTRVPPHTCR